MSIETALRKGDVVRTAFPGRDLFPLYLGSGSSGGCFDGWGFLHDGTTAATAPDAAPPAIRCESTDVLAKKE